MEQRLHIVIHLPNDHPAEATAYRRIRKHLAMMFPGEGFALFKRVEGYWISPGSMDLIRDYSTLFVTDIPLPETPDTAGRVAQLLLDIRTFALTAYRAAGRPQDEIWVTSHPITRHGT